MCTARSSSRLGGLHQAPPWEQTPPPGSRHHHPPDQTPLLEQALPTPWDQTPPPRAGTPREQAPPPVNRITDTCKNITFPRAVKIEDI